MTRVGVTYSKLICLPRFSSTSLRMPPTYSSLVRILACDDGLANGGDRLRLGPARGVVDLNLFSIGHRDLIADAGCGGDQVQLVLALKTFLNDLHMEEAEEAAAEAEAEGERSFPAQRKKRSR